jgi:hypothetical protein
MYKRESDFLNLNSTPADENVDSGRISQQVKLYSVLQIKSYMLLISESKLGKYLVILLKHLIM